MILRSLVVGRLSTNCYLVGCEHTHEALIIDPGDDAELILNAVDELGVKVTHIVLTHFHFDHLLAAGPLRSATGASLAIHHSEAPYLSDPPALFRLFSPHVPHDLVADRQLHHGDSLTIGQVSVKILHTPGHSPGGISLWIAEEGVVFCGDALFREGRYREEEA